MTVEVLDPGFHAALRDGGRAGHAGEGLPGGGFADARSARLANVLVGNPPDAPLIEFAIRAPRLRLSGSGAYALTGAECDLAIDGAALPRWRRLQLRDGGVIGGGGARAGVYGYLAVGGTWEVPRWRGSVGSIRLGGRVVPPGGELVRGRRFSIRVASVPGSASTRIPADLAPGISSPTSLAVWSAPETEAWWRALGRAFGGQAAAVSARWEVQTESNRVGSRLRGPAMPAMPEFAQMRSVPVLPGTVQLTPEGTLLVIGVDGPTMGGYPRIGRVDKDDLGALAQVMPGRGSVRLAWHLDGLGPGGSSGLKREAGRPSS